MTNIVTREISGNNATPKNSPLTYAEMDNNLIALNDNKLEVSEKGVPNCLATLDNDGKLTEEQIPIGTSGYSGWSGTSGISGYTGQDGIIGVDGTSGYSGWSGTIGISGYSGWSGALGICGILLKVIIFGAE